MTDYGIFGNLVVTSGCLAAAGASIGLSWRKRSKWQPPEETVPQAVSRVSSLAAMVIIAWLFVFGGTIGLNYLALISGFLLIVAVIALMLCIKTNITYSFYYPNELEENRLLGGSELTPEALEISKNKLHSEQEMLQDLHGDRSKLWTRSSMANISIISTLSYIVLIAFGTAAMASSAMLVVVFSTSH